MGWRIEPAMSRKVRPTSGKIRTYIARIPRKIMTKREKLWRGVWRGRGWGVFAFSSGSSAIPRARVARRISSFAAPIGMRGNPFPERRVRRPGGFHEVGDSREGEGGPDRVPLAHHEVRRSEGAVPVRAAGEGRRGREAGERGPV